MSCRTPKHVCSVSLSCLDKVAGHFVSRRLMAGVMLTLGCALCACSRQSDEPHAESAAAAASEPVAVARTESTLDEHGSAVVPDEAKPLTVHPVNGARAKVVPERAASLSPSALKADDMQASGTGGTTLPPPDH